MRHEDYHRIAGDEHSRGHMRNRTRCRRDGPATPLKPKGRSIAVQMKPEGWRALHDLALDRNTSLQKLAIEALNDLLVKHGRKQKIESAWD
jgi:hypothetical protein